VKQKQEIKSGKKSPSGPLRSQDKIRRLRRYVHIIQRGIGAAPVTHADKNHCKHPVYDSIGVFDNNIKNKQEIYDKSRKMNKSPDIQCRPLNFTSLSESPYFCS